MGLMLTRIVAWTEEMPHFVIWKQIPLDKGGAICYHRAMVTIFLQYGLNGMTVSTGPNKSKDALTLTLVETHAVIDHYFNYGPQHDKTTCPLCLDISKKSE